VRLEPAEDQAGRACLFDTMTDSDVPRLVESLRASRRTSQLKVIARAASTVEGASGRQRRNCQVPLLSPLTHMHRR